MDPTVSNSTVSSASAASEAPMGSLPDSSKYNNLIAEMNAMMNGGTVVMTNDGTVQTMVFPGVLPAFEDEVNSYYQTCQNYQTQIENLTKCLTDVAGGDYTGTNTVTFTLPGGSVTNMTVQQYMKTYGDPPSGLNTDAKKFGDTALCNLNMQTINAAISPLQNNLSTEQSFLNSAVSELQSQVTQFSQLFSSFYQSLTGVAQDI